MLIFLEPPSPPEINGLPQNETLREGQSVQLVIHILHYKVINLIKAIKYFFTKTNDKYLLRGHSKNTC